MGKLVARYCISGLGFVVWSPDNRGLPDFWFGSREEVQKFAESNGWKLVEI